MNICKILDLTPGIEMTSWGTIHFPEEKRIMEFVVNVQSTRWRSLRYGPCVPEPEGGFDEIKRAQEEHLALFGDLDPGKFKAQMICKEGISTQEVISLVLGELQRSGFPYSIRKEADSLKKKLESCRTPVSGRAARRFEAE